MVENSSDNSLVRALDQVERAHDSDGNGDVNVEVDHDDDEEVLMKRMISKHPLFELLIETHINCLKVGLCDNDFEDEEVIITTTDKLVEKENKIELNASSIDPTTPELDEFMEAYCMALNKLKEAMEEPLQDATSFINNMYAQLNELTLTEHTDVEDQTLLLNHEK